MTIEKMAFSIDEAAEALGLSSSAVKEVIYAGQIKIVRVGRRVLIPRWALTEFLNDAESATAARDSERLHIL